MELQLEHENNPTHIRRLISIAHVSAGCPKMTDGHTRVTWKKRTNNQKALIMNSRLQHETSTFSSVPRKSQFPLTLNGMFSLYFCTTPFFSFSLSLSLSLSLSQLFSYLAFISKQEQIKKITRERTREKEKAQKEKDGEREDRDKEDRELKQQAGDLLKEKEWADQEGQGDLCPV